MLDPLSHAKRPFAISQEVPAKKNKVENIQLLDLPPELLGIIYDHLDPVMKAVSRCVCRRFAVILPKFYEDLHGNQVERYGYWRARDTYGPCGGQPLCEKAAKYGYAKVVQWACSRGFPFFSQQVFASAAVNGQQAFLVWGQTTGELEYDSVVSEAAARGGHLDLLLWLRAYGPAWNSEICVGAAGGGQLKILKWLRANSIPWDKHVSHYAARGGHLEALKWLRKNEAPPWDSNVCAQAAEGGHLEVLMWLRVNGAPWDEWTIRTCTLYGNFESKNEFIYLLHWALVNGAPLPSDISSLWWSAARCRHFPTLDWLLNYCQGVVSDDAALQVFMAGGEHFEVLRWMFDKGAKWSEQVIENAIKRDLVEFFQFAYVHGHLIHKDLSCEAAKHGSP